MGMVLLSFVCFVENLEDYTLFEFTEKMLHYPLQLSGVNIVIIGKKKILRGTKNL